MGEGRSRVGEGCKLRRPWGVHGQDSGTVDVDERTHLIFHHPLTETTIPPIVSAEHRGFSSTSDFATTKLQVSALFRDSYYQYHLY